MPRERDVSFKYEIPHLDVILSVEAEVRVPLPSHTHPNDPDNDGEIIRLEVSDAEGREIDPADLAFKRPRDGRWITLDQEITERVWEQAR